MGIIEVVQEAETVAKVRGVSPCCSSPCDPPYVNRSKRTMVDRSLEVVVEEKPDLGLGTVI